MPCGLGMHPYFRCSRTTMLRTQVSHVWTVDENVLPVAKIEATGRYDLSSGPICGRALDNGYAGWGGKALIEDAEAPFSICLSSPDTLFFQLYSPAQGGLFVAEPVSHANDALSHDEGDWPALGMKVLAPGETIALAMRLDVIRRLRT
jgi:aldose 1-epimerase